MAKKIEAWVEYGPRLESATPMEGTELIEQITVGSNESVSSAYAVLTFLDKVMEQALKAGADETSLRDGLQLIQRELLATLARLGLAVHDPVGQPFDPLTDQALLHEEVPEAAEGTVVETLRKGYLFKERLLRPAMVKVAKAHSTPESEA